LEKLSGAEVERRGYQRLTVKGLVTDLKRPERLVNASLRPCGAAGSASHR